MIIEVEKCKLTKYPAKVLMHKAEPIEDFNDNIKQLADKMIEIMVANQGVGLAGPQAGVSLRMFIISTDATAENAVVYINPVIEPTGAVETVEEGCLSFPGINTKIKRPNRCKVTAYDLDGNEFTQEADELLARALQHEYDHIEGVTIKDRMSVVGKIASRKKLKELEAEAL